MRDGTEASRRATVRVEGTGDAASIRSVVEAAFGRRDEADLVDRLRADGMLLSLVAEHDGGIIGHVVFSRMTIETDSGPVAAVSLAPLAVSPQHQRLRVGTQLVEQGISELRARGERIIIVLGHPRYYSRFGFSTSAAAGLASPFPRDAFMALELAAGALSGVRGAVRYPAAFGLS